MLISFELTINELMETDENDKVDSTKSHAATLDAANKDLPGPSKKTSFESNKAKQAARIDAAKSRAAEIFIANTPLQQSDPEKSLQKQLCEQKEQVEKLNKQLQSSTPEPNYDISIDLFESSYTVAKNEGAATDCVKAAVPLSLVELVPGYGERLTQRELDETISESGGAPNKLIRKLVSVFFSRVELAESSCYGLRNNNADT
uniref:BEN domain-containing protein n=1 Tax=Amphimedon queenslandica TaxID=400682 RepID=A0A1X7U9U2_AMPQE